MLLRINVDVRAWAGLITPKGAYCTHSKYTIQQGEVNTNIPECMII